MSKSIVTLLMLVFCNVINAQIEFEKVNPEVKKNRVLQYDSTSNDISNETIWSLKGQTLFGTGVREPFNGYSRFSLQTKLKADDYSDNITYFQVKDDILPYSEYDSIVGHYFYVEDIIEIEAQDPKDENDVLLKLYDNKRKKYVYYKHYHYSSSAPFLILGYYQKEKEKIGKKFRVTRKETYLRNYVTNEKDRVDTKESLAISKIVIDTDSWTLYYFFEDSNGNSYKLEDSTYDFMIESSSIEYR